ncbi:MAG TPA: hypothetical protein VHB21_11420 [Minicystis sp.]|nr:hypothetical protein [Minicystis sp.]
MQSAHGLPAPANDSGVDLVALLRRELARLRVRAVADVLAADGVVGRSGKPLTKTAVHNILRALAAADGAEAET